MYRACSLFVLWISLVTFSQAVSDEYDPSQPLFLTPLIKSGEIERAQLLATVQPFLAGIASYSGYITVDEKLRSHAFFWFCPKKNHWTEAPLILWLNGGPGLSSMYGFFTENGPYTLTNDGQLGYRTYTWTNYYNMLYIDNPVGTGLSFTESADGYSTDQTQVGEHLHEALRQFLILFPQLQGNQLVLSGESYAGKYLTTLANTISQKKGRTKPEMNVFGIFLGNPAISFEHMLPHYNEFLYAYGLLDRKTRETLRTREEDILSLIYANSWPEATNLFENTFFEGESDVTLLYQLTGLHNHYNILEDRLHDPPYSDFLKMPEVKRALHVGNYTFDVNNSLAKKALRYDLLKSFKPYFERVLENYRVLVFSGQFDIICAYYLNEGLFDSLSWSGANAYHVNDRYQLRWNETLAGYYKQAFGFTHAFIRDAGHVAITDQPRWVLGLLKKFLAGTFDEYIQSLEISYDDGQITRDRKPDV